MSNEPVLSMEIPELLQTHFNHLHQGSGISMEVIEERGYKSVLAEVELIKLGFAKSQYRKLGILIPLWGVDGQKIGYTYRPDNPREDSRSRKIKYENVKGSSLRLDCLPSCQENLGDPAIPLWITEGLKKGDALVSHGLCAVVLSGVWGFKGRNSLGGVTLLADWDHIALDGRRVYIVFDSDVAVKPQVQQALLRLVEHLRRRRAEVFEVLLPSSTGEKVGADDYLLSHSVDELLTLAKNALDIEPAPFADIAGILKSIENGTVTPKVAVSELRYLPHTPIPVRRNLISQVVLGTLEQRGKFIRSVSERFYFDATAKQLVHLDSFEFGVLLNELFGLNQTEPEFKYCLADAHNRAHRSEEAEVCQLAFYSPTGNVLYVDRFDGRMYRLNGQKIELVDNGTDGVLFMSQLAWRPYYLVDPDPDAELIARLLIDDIPFQRDSSTPLTPDEQRMVLLLWILSLFFGTILPTKPILVFVGVKGSGKTTAERRVLCFLFGPDVDVTALEREKEDAFISTITYNPLVVLDNLDGKISWINDRLATAASGTLIQRRRLYTTNELATFRPRAFLAITTRTPHFRRDDVADRLILLNVSRLESFKTEKELLTAVDSCRNQLWTELLATLNMVVGNIGKVEGAPAAPFRASDWANLCWRIAQIQAVGSNFDAILHKLCLQQSTFLLEDDPAYACLKVWLEDERNQGREVSARELYTELSQIAQQEQIDWPYRNALSLAKRIRNVESNLRQLCQLTIRPTARGRLIYAFKPETGVMT